MMDKDRELEDYEYSAEKNPRKVPPCHGCGGTDFIAMMDCLAVMCKKCTEVWVGFGPDDWTPGKSGKQWAEDVYNAKKAME